ncbi:MAG: hypothetical protein HY690_08595 [Chloroflexi bacterium]|nr:hypothetical protein [Chloroflexota bacterium]
MAESIASPAERWSTRVRGATLSLGRRLAGSWPLGGRPRARQRELVVALLELAFERRGCPVCVLADQSDGKGLWILLWENVNDPWVRAELRAALGYCPVHWRRLDGVAQSGGLGVMGQAALAQDLAETIARRLHRALAGRARLATALDTRASCPACTRRAFTERSALDALGRWSDDPAVWEGYQRSDGLCLPHLNQVHSRQSTVYSLLVSFRLLTVDCRLRIGALAPSRGALIEAGLRRVQQLSAQLSGPAGPEWVAVEGTFWEWHRPPQARRAGSIDCPVCLHQLATERQAVERWAEASVATPLCPEHAAWLAGSRAEPALLASHRTAMGAAHKEVERRIEGCARQAEGWPRWWPRPRPAPGAPLPLSCSACAAGVEAAQAACQQPLRLDAGELLCLPHLRLALRAPGAETMASAEAAGLRALAALLGEFLRKSDWNHRDEPRGEEQRSWPHARAFVIGPERCLAPAAAGRRTED